MKFLFQAIVLSLFLTGFAASAAVAQNKASGTGTVSRPLPKPKKNALDMSTIDFKNYNFPDFTGQGGQTIRLKNGRMGERDDFPHYTLRETYYFDLTGDTEKEAISHIIAVGCQMGCERSNLFYIYTADGIWPKLLWKIATGGDVLGGLKSARFNVDEIVMEVFGNCRIENQIIKAEVDLKKNAKLKTTNYTRFVFTKGANGFVQTAKNVLPLTTDVDFTTYKAQIHFGSSN